MNTKEFYTSPEVDVLVVQTEGVICQSNKYGKPGEAGNGFGNGGSYDL